MTGLFNNSRVSVVIPGFGEGKERVISSPVLPGCFTRLPDFTGCVCMCDFRDACLSAENGLEPPKAGQQQGSNGMQAILGLLLPRG